MKSHTVIMIAGIILIIIAVVLVGVIYEKGIENKKVLIIPSNSSDNYTFSLSKSGHYTVFITAQYNIDYVLYHNGSIISNKSNVKDISIKLTNAYGTYKLNVSNHQNKSNEVMIVVTKGSEMNYAYEFTYISGSICAVGMITFVVGLTLLLWHRKKEEKQYSRY